MGDEMVKVGDAEPKLTIEQSLGRYVENSELSDVCFLVGEEREKIQAHRFPLAIGSEVFKAMLYGELKEPNHEIEVPDLTPAGFRNMLKYFYTKKIEKIDLSEFCETYMAANKYLVTDLIRDLLDHVRSCLDVSNVCVIYEQLLKLKIDDSFFGEVKHLIATKFLEVCKSENFMKIKKDTLVSILKFNRLNVSELKLLNVCIDWTDWEVKRQGLHLDYMAKKRAAFEPFKTLIRFGDLEPLPFGRILQLQYYLTAEEIGSIFLHLMYPSCNPIQIDYQSPRGTSKIQVVKGSFGGYSHLNWSTNPQLGFSLSVDKACFISSFETFPLHEFERLTIEVEISNDEVLTLNVTVNHPTKFPFPLTVKLDRFFEPKTNYEIRFLFSTDYCRYKYEHARENTLKSDESEAVFSLKPKSGNLNFIEKIEFIGPFE